MLAIRTEGLTKEFHPRGREPVRAVDDLHFEVERGAVFGLLGPNGAGKTTAIRMLTTLLRPTRGRGWVMGHEVAAEPLEVRRRISVVLQETAVEMFLTVKDNLLTFARFHGIGRREAERRARAVMDELRLASESDRKVWDLSGGFRRRVQVAKIFMVDTPVVFLDEFSTGMDPILKREVMERLRGEAERGRTIVLTTQILSEAEELCDDILILDGGRQIARGDLNALKLLSRDVYEVAMTFDAPPVGFEEELAGIEVVRSRVSQTTLELALRAEESRVLEVVSRLAARGRVLRLEVGGATLEDVFVQLLKNARPVEKGARPSAGSRRLSS